MIVISYKHCIINECSVEMLRVCGCTNKVWLLYAFLQIVLLYRIFDDIRLGRNHRRAWSNDSSRRSRWPCGQRAERCLLLPTRTLSPASGDSDHSECSTPTYDNTRQLNTMRRPVVHDCTRSIRMHYIGIGESTWLWVKSLSGDSNNMWWIWV